MAGRCPDLSDTRSPREIQPLACPCPPSSTTGIYCHPGCSASPHAANVLAVRQRGRRRGRRVPRLPAVSPVPNPSRRPVGPRTRARVPGGPPHHRRHARRRARSRPRPAPRCQPSPPPPAVPRARRRDPGPGGAVAPSALRAPAPRRHRPLDQRHRVRRRLRFGAPDVAGDARRLPRLADGAARRSAASRIGSSPTAASTRASPSARRSRGTSLLAFLAARAVPGVEFVGRRRLPPHDRGRRPHRRARGVARRRPPHRSVPPPDVARAHPPRGAGPTAVRPRPSTRTAPARDHTTTRRSHRGRTGLRVPGSLGPVRGRRARDRRPAGERRAARRRRWARSSPHYGTPAPGLDALGLRSAFPDAAALADADLPMPRRRAAAVRAFAAAVAEGRIALDGSIPLECLAEQLCALPGIGPWTAQYLALRLGYADAFPASDLGVLKALGGRDAVRRGRWPRRRGSLEPVARRTPTRPALDAANSDTWSACPAPSTLTVDQARRIALAAQGFGERRPTGRGRPPACPQGLRPPRARPDRLGQRARAQPLPPALLAARPVRPRRCSTASRTTTTRCSSTGVTRRR